MADEFVRRDEYEARHQELEKRFSELKEEILSLGKKIDLASHDNAILVGRLEAYKILVPVLTGGIGILVGFIIGIRV